MRNHVSAGFRIVFVSAVCVLASCGGGGGNGDGDSGGPPPPPPPSANMVVTGTVASGAALAAAVVDAKCLGGAGSATSAADGTYTVTIADGRLPCVVRATAGALVLHSIASGAGSSSARANITPVTELVVAHLTGGAPAAYFAGFAPISLDTAAGRFNASIVTGNLSTSIVGPVASAVIASLQANGLDLTGVGDPLGGPLVAASGSTAGDAHDQALDRLDGALTASGVTLDVLTQAVALASPNAPVESHTTVALLPPERLLAASASNCASFRSGRYRLIVNEAAASPAQVLVDFNATTLALKDLDSGATASLIATGPCTFQNPSGGEVAVSRSGVAIGRVTGPDLQLHAFIAVPEQPHSVAELAGVWNYVSMERTIAGGPVHLTAGTAVFDLSGHLTAQDFCDDMKTCAAVPAAQLPAILISLNGVGGFELAYVGTSNTDRLFAYRAGGGELMLLQIAASGRIVYYTRKTPAVLPPVGRTQQGMNAFVSSLYTAPAAMSLSGSTITSTDPASGSYVRSAIQNFTTGATRPETFVINSPREGYVRRVAGPALHTDGTASNVVEFVSLSMRGMDMSVFGLTQSNQLGLFATTASSTP